MARKKRKLKRKLPFIIFCLLMVALFAAGYALVSEVILPSDHVAGAGDNDKDKDNVPNIKGRLNFLLMGMDARPGETKARTDTMILVSVDSKANRIAMMSIPRDTRVEIPGHGVDKINAANVYGGPELATETVSRLLNVPIDYYVLTNFEGFKDIVDAVGGVDMYVEQDMQYYDPADGTHINLKKGQQHLDGDKALQYVRYRGYVNGDIDRTAHQQKFLRALAQEVLQPSTVTKLHKLVPSINKAVDTNLGLTQMVKLAKAARSLSSTDIVTQTLPGRFMTIDGISYWYVEPAQAQKAVAQLFEGKTMEVVQGETIIKNTKKQEEEPESTDLARKETGPSSGEAANEAPKTDEQQEAGQTPAGSDSKTDNTNDEAGQVLDNSQTNEDENAGQQEPAQGESNSEPADGTPWLPQDGGAGQQDAAQPEST
ncbi:MAG: LCP family protein [Desulfotomaculum sp.]|nr:LCP family protein [Desulfotomaculum sp.]